MKKTKILTCGLSLLTAIAATAIPAKRSALTFTQPDGTTVILTPVGDEHNHHYLTQDGQVVLNDGNAFYFARLDGNGNIVPSEFLATDLERRSDLQKHFLANLSQDNLKEAVANRVPARRIQAQEVVAETADAALPQIGIGLFPGTKFPSFGEVRGLVILVNYTDVKFQTPDANEYFYRLLNEPGFSEDGNTGSARDWFLDGSYNQFIPTFDVYGPIELPQNRKYYGGNNSMGDDKNPEQMIVDACKYADEEIDFSKYDFDNDGYVDNVFVFYAGKGEADSNVSDAVWPHEYNLSYVNKSFSLDGKKIDAYACANEISANGKPTGIGGFVHEFSHVLGLPDLYDTVDAENYVTPWSYSIMDYGSYNNDGRTPPTYSIFERNALKWADITLIDRAATCTLENIIESNSGYLIQTNKENEFFLLENRQKIGWDKYIPGHGMLVWHIDYNANKWTYNTVNNNKSHQYVDILEAGGTANGMRATTLAQYPFPGTKKVTTLTALTKPALKSWAGYEIDLPITNITEDEKVITFDVLGGGAPLGITDALTDCGVRINGRQVSAQFGTVDAYDMYGRKVGSGESFLLPSSGIYIITSDKGSFKTAVK